MVNFTTLDLNLLRVFDAMLEERSVTRVGARLGVTPSAVSHALSRLRDILVDELFVKTPEGMTATARARAIAPLLHAGLAQLHASLATETFDPARSERVFTLAMDPYARAIVLPGLIARVRRAAPGVELRIKPGFLGVTDALHDGRLDLAIASYRSVPERFAARDLLTERLVWALSASNPVAAAPLTLQALAALPHLVRILSDGDDDRDGLTQRGHGLVRRMMQDDDGALRRALAGIRRHRSVKLTVPDSFAALAVVGDTDLAALVPERMGRMLAARFDLRLFDPPYDCPPIPLSAVWHRTQAGPALDWLLDATAAAATAA